MKAFIQTSVIYPRRLVLTSKQNKNILQLSHSRFQSSTPTPSSTNPSSQSQSQSSSESILSLSSQYILPVYARPPIIFTRGSGAYLWDTTGRKYLDFSAGIAVNVLGHADEEFADFMYEQAKTLIHTSNVYHHEWAGRLAELLVTLTKREGGLGWAAQDGSSNENNDKGAKVFFSNSGTEATEAALKIARKIGKERSSNDSKHRIVCFENAFHGRSMGALSVTPKEAYQKPFGPLIPGIDVGKLNDEREGALEALITEETCGVIVEPIQGEGGVYSANGDWLRKLRKRCDEVGAVLIFDEIQCGLYRTGTLWAHSILPIDAHPDIITMAKPLANGYPIGAVMMRDEIAATMNTGSHGTTFGGSAMACALGHHVLRRISKKEFVSQMKENSGYLIEGLKGIVDGKSEIVETDIRGRGMILGLGMVKEENAGKVVSYARERGVLLLTAGKGALRLIPSLNISRLEIDQCLRVLHSVFGMIE